MYFDSISNEILNIKNNISIWYLDQDKEIIDCEEYFFDLSQMQLFVIPITRKFLVEKCHARMTEFVYAVEQHIPILPIVQEKGLDDLFNITCGNMQFLNKYIDNTVSISYTNRLRNFLDMILFNENLSSEPQAREELIISISVLASVYCDEKKFIKASEYCRQGIKKARKMLEEKFDKKLVKEVVYLYDHTLENCVKAEIRENKVIENMREGIRMIGEILLDFMPSQVYIEYKSKYSRLAENAKAGEKNKEIYEQLVKILGQIILPEYDEKVTRQYIGY